MRTMTIRGIATLSLLMSVGIWSLIIIWVHKTGPEAVLTRNLYPNIPDYSWKFILFAAIGGILAYGVALLIRSSESWGATSDFARLSICVGLLVTLGLILVRENLLEEGDLNFFLGA